MPALPGMYQVTIEEVLDAPDGVRVIGTAEGETVVDGGPCHLISPSGLTAVREVTVETEAPRGKVALLLRGVSSSEVDAGYVLIGSGPQPDWWADAVDRVRRHEGWHRHDAMVLQGRLCPSCGSPAGDLLVYRHKPSGRLFLMCEELEEGWWHPDNVSPTPEVFPFRDLRDWELASESDLVAAGWDETRFRLEEKWWTD